MPVADCLSLPPEGIVLSRNKRTRASTVRAYVAILPPVGRKPLTRRHALHHSSLSTRPVQQRLLIVCLSLLEKRSRSRGTNQRWKMGGVVDEHRAVKMEENGHAPSSHKVCYDGWEPLQQQVSCSVKEYATCGVPTVCLPSCTISTPNATTPGPCSLQIYYWFDGGLLYELSGVISLS
jgi:hypothetical protein